MENKKEKFLSGEVFQMFQLDEYEAFYRRNVEVNTNSQSIVKSYDKSFESPYYSHCAFDLKTVTEVGFTCSVEILGEVLYKQAEFKDMLFLPQF